MNILGISAFYHDSAACLLQDGALIAAAQEERFTRKKHDHDLPKNAIEYCLEEAGLTVEQLDYVAFYEKPLLKFDRLLQTWLAFAPSGLSSFFKGIPQWLQKKLHHQRELDRGLGGGYRGRFVFPEHHESHAASAFFPSPFDEAAILTMDGVGEWATTTWGIGRGNTIELSHEIRFPHSIGLLYSAFTYYTGFKVNSGEYKVMGLAPYGEPRFASTILENLIDLKADGSFRLDMRYFNYCQGLTMTSEAFHRLFGGPPRKPESPVTQREMDLAASIQAVTEEVMLRTARHIAKTTRLKNLVMAGGVALNCVGNGKILRDGCFDNIWVQPAAGDAGGALGAAVFVWHQLLGKPRDVDGVYDQQRGSLLGPNFEGDGLRAFFEQQGAKYHYYSDEDALVDVVSEALVNQKVVGHMAGRMEFGPRALGNRSILGDPRSPEMQRTMNLKIKFRESFRPFAPSVLRDAVDEWFEMRPQEESPYMLLVAPVCESKRLAEGNTADKKGIELLNVVRSKVPAVTHVDFSARVQTVDEQRNPRYYRLIKRFEQKTGCPLVINTSFNIRGEPIVCTPADAYHCFLGCNMDVLVVDKFVLYKDEQPESHVDVEQYKDRFELD
ncbi:MAG: carbamoyltransferase [Deltaproteobacteria bacterium]|nr:carbamoyltransferase [Deltaproteobacteria bacterium]